MKKRKEIHLPLTNLPMCGHSFDNGYGDLMIGREESMMLIHGKKVDYRSHIVLGPCSRCNKAQERRLRNMVAKLEKQK